MTLDLATVARHGALLALAFSALIMGSLRYNPRLFLRHFPAAVRASQLPLSGTEKRAGRLIGVVLILLLVVVPIWSAGAAAASQPYARLDTFLHAFLVAMMANAVDWLVLDELWLGWGRPQWALPPGVTLADVPFDHAQHARGFVTGTVLCAAVGALAALIV